MKLFKKLNKGFTLVELVVVIAVIAILSAVSVVAYTSITKNAKKTTAQANADQIAMTIRASALANANGYKEQSGEVAHTFLDSDEDDKCDHCGEAAGETHKGKLPYTVSWSSTGLVVERHAADSREVKDILLDMYMEIEGLTAEQVEGVHINAEAFGSGHEKTIASFTYQKDGGYEDPVTASLL